MASGAHFGMTCLKSLKRPNIEDFHFITDVRSPRKRPEMKAANWHNFKKKLQNRQTFATCCNYATKEKGIGGIGAKNAKCWHVKKAFHIFGVQPDGQWNQADSCWRRFQQPSSVFQTPHIHIIHIVDHSTGSWVKYDSRDKIVTSSMPMWPMWHEKNVQRLQMNRSYPIIFWNRGSGEAEASLHPCVHANFEHSTASSRKFKGFLYSGLAKTALGTAFTHKSLEKCEAEKRKINFS